MVAFVRGYFTLDMTIGAVILGIWQYVAPADALVSAPLVASALIAGDGVWSVPSAILALAKVTPPMCAQVKPVSHSICAVHSLSSVNEVARDTSIQPLATLPRVHLRTKWMI